VVGERGRAPVAKQIRVFGLFFENKRLFFLFFFEKKNQKTFADLVLLCGGPALLFVIIGARGRAWGNYR
jgi:hypothetical protein